MTIIKERDKIREDDVNRSIGRFGNKSLILTSKVIEGNIDTEWHENGDGTDSEDLYAYTKQRTGI